MGRHPKYLPIHMINELKTISQDGLDDEGGKLMRQSLNEGQEILNNILKDMGKEVERILQGCIETLKSLDRTQAEYWIAQDQVVNNLERQVDDECVRLIATQQPVAKDLRKVISAMKISTDLERMSDLAIGIAKVTRRIEGPPVSYTHLRAHETRHDLVCRLLLE